MPDQKEATLTYRRWTLVIPILFIIVGAILINFSWGFNPILGLLGGGLAFIGILTLGYLLVIIISFEVATRKLTRRPLHHPILSEEMEEKESAQEQLTKEKKEH